MTLVHTENKHVATFVKTQLRQGESVVVGIGASGGEIVMGALIVTNERIALFNEKGFLRPERLDSLWYDTVASIEASQAAGLGERGFILTIAAAGKTLKVHCMEPGLLGDGGKSRMAEYLGAVTNAFRAVRSGHAQTSAPPERTTAQRLSELASLHAQGLLTQQEYEQQRKRIVEGI
jgi:hypothetical protein